MAREHAGGLLPAFSSRAGGSPDRPPDGTAHPSGFLTRRGAGVAVAVLFVGAISLYRTEFSQYELGHKAGVQHVRETSKKGTGMNAANRIDLIPNNPDASADGNAGLRAGFKEVWERMYSETKGR